MYTASSNGFWFRSHSAGIASAWAYSAGPRFHIDMYCYGCGRHVACFINGVCIDETALTNTEEIREWIASNWKYHVKKLSYHEQMEYINLGLLQESD